jgi:hypothetical protein
MEKLGRCRGPSTLGYFYFCLYLLRAITILPLSVARNRGMYLTLDLIWGF